MKVDLNDIYQLQTCFAYCYPGLGFSISDGEPGKTLYDKLTMAEGGGKPALEEFKAEAKKNGFNLN